MIKMNKKQKFIVTQDKETANRLIADGFRLVTEINGTYTFENNACENATFSKVDKCKLAYTNLLSM